ncbi:MAG: serine/threonine-protein phosphatase [Prevotella sp.]|nr:serine/threonine-protein phosphatase [Prevotella sp.]
MSEVKFKMAAGTNVGLVRTNNEDNFIVCPDLATSTWLIPQDSNYADLGELGALLVVADGMGGANAGEVASAICVNTIQNMFTPDRLATIVTDEKAVQQFMADVVRTADLNIMKHGRKSKSTRGMGTTVVMAWILGKRAYICWCGDSRCYVYNAQRGLMRLSKDHSYVQELVDSGLLKPELASEHPMSNVITRCLGDVEKRANPDTRVYELYSGDTILLCSDGLSGLCSDEIIAHIIATYSQTPMDCCKVLIDAALQGGGHDNVTVALSTVGIEGEEMQMPEESTYIAQKERDGLRATLVPFPIAKNESEETEDVVAETEEEATEEKPLTEKDTDTEKKTTPEEMAEEEAISLDADKPSEEAEPTEEAVAEEDASKTETEAEEEKATDGNGEKEEEEQKQPAKEEEKEEEEKPTKKSHWLRAILFALLFVAIMAVIYICVSPECRPIRNDIYNTLQNTINSLRNP